ncbi:MAG: TolC family protein [Sulfurimonas sp.]|uniref:TolC family protein n=1 Tax=Sulfurimonas sp. TaxID=2022749 RepID=UPI00261AFD21|nr:TolC family protein [Sulfurimonas sp.]MDD2652776.1 TolC family protein [Sulfurimonas sp.]MDD3452087.1 TolC family protein [Sulfurimonas sp.]
MRLFFPILFTPIFLYASSLQELIDVSQKNRAVASALHVVASKEKAYESSKSGYLPTLDILGTYQNVYDETPTLAQNSLKAQASLKYVIYDGGKKESVYGQLESTVASSKKSVEALKNDISLDVARLYFEYLSLEADKTATLREIEQLKAEFKRLQLFYEAGSVTKDEVAKVDSRTKNALVALQEIELESQKILHTLEYYTTQKVSSIQKGSLVRLPQEDTALLPAEIQALEDEALSVLFSANVLKSQNMPTLYFEDTLSYSDYYFDQKPANSLADTQNIATLNVAWNIFDFGSRTQAYQSKFQEYLSKKSLIEHEKHKADVDYRLAKKSLEIATVKVEAAKATLEAASATYELIKFKYQNGTIDNVAYLLALSEKYDASRGYERAMNDLQIKKAELIYYSGKDIKEFL